MIVAESPHFIDVGSETLFGIMTRPQAEPNGVGVVVLHGGGDHNLPSHRNRWTVEFARGLATDGYTVLRVGFRGVGESTGNNETFALSDPFVSDGVAIVNALAAEPGVHRIYAVGSCFGARTAVGVAAELPVVEGLVLSALPVADPEKRKAMDNSTADFLKRGFGRKGLAGLLIAGRRDRYLRILTNKIRSLTAYRTSGANPTPWVADSVVGGLRAVAGRGGRVLLVYGTEDDFYAQFREAQAGPLGVLAASPAIEVDASVVGRLHGYPSVAVQEAFVERASAWIRRID